MENFDLLPGQTEEAEFTVEEAHTAKSMGSGSGDILATPMLAAWMEATAGRLAARALPDGWQTVGSYIEIKHDAMTPAGEKVRVRAELGEKEGRELVFRIEAFDETGTVAEAVHKRILSKTAVLMRAMRQRKRKS